MSDIAALAPPVVAAVACFFLVRGIYQFLQREEADEARASLEPDPAVPDPGQPSGTDAAALPADIAVVPVAREPDESESAG
jgi:hypothetical protein